MTAKLTRTKERLRGKKISQTQKVYDHSDFMDALREAADMLGRPPGIQTYSKLRKKHKKDYWPSGARFLQVYGKWNQALRLAGLEARPLPKGLGQARYTANDYFDALNRVANDLGRDPTHAEYSRLHHTHEPSAEAFRNKFGTWIRALDSLVPDAER